MANNYSSFSSMLEGITQEGKMWLEDKLRNKPASCDSCSNSYRDTKCTPTPTEDAPFCENFDDDCPYSFDWAFEERKDEPGVWDLWLHHDEGCAMDDIMDVIQEYLQKFNPKGYFRHSWSDTCSKPRIDEFGGGACLVTADSIQWMNTEQWLHDRIKELKDK